MGPEMMQKLRDQAERFGARLMTDQAERVELASEPGGIHKVWVGDTEYRARTVVLAMGAEHKKLGVPGELELSGRGVSYCATCDAAFFRDTPDAHRRRRRLGDGGGDLPFEVRERGDDRAPARRVPGVEDHARPRARAREHRAADAVHRQASSSPARTARWDTPLLVNAQTGEERELEVSGAFVAVGHEPQSTLVARADRRRRERLCGRRGSLDADQPPGRVRRRRSRRPHLPPGDHRRGLGLPGGARRRVVPARHARGSHPGGDAGRGSRRGAVGARRDARSDVRAPHR